MAIFFHKRTDDFVFKIGYSDFYLEANLLSYSFHINNKNYKKFLIGWLSNYQIHFAIIHKELNIVHAVYQDGNKIRYSVQKNGE